MPYDPRMAVADSPLAAALERVGDKWSLLLIESLLSGPLPFNEHLSFKDAKEQLLENFEREYVTSVLARCEGNLSRAARERHRFDTSRPVKTSESAPCCH